MKSTNTILDDIIANKLIEIEEAKKHISLENLKDKIRERKTKVRDFYNAITKQDEIGVIAEIKQSSPSKGLLKNDFDPIEIAMEYQKAGVNAISVLTDKKFFQGDLDYVRKVKAVTQVPILRKDFIIDEYQIYESYLAEADAILLIVAALEKEQVNKFLHIANSLNIACIVEVHTQEELHIALESSPKIIGVNARDLKTFAIDKKLFQILLSSIPDKIIKIAESGIETNEDLQFAEKAGAQAVLVGSSLMESANIGEKIRELKGDNYVTSI